MRPFKDRESGAWSIDLTIGEVARVKLATSGRFNLIDPAPKLADELASDELAFWELLWHIVEPDAVRRQITAETFGRLMAADCLHLAREQFFAEWIDFFRQLHRPDKAAVVEKAAQYLAKAMELTAAKLASPQMAELDALLARRMETSLNDSFGKLLDSWASIPADSPGDNWSGSQVGSGEP